MVKDGTPAGPKSGITREYKRVARILGEYSHGDLNELPSNAAQSSAWCCTQPLGLVRMQCALRRDRSLGGMWKTGEAKTKIKPAKGNN